MKTSFLPALLLLGGLSLPIGGHASAQDQDARLEYQARSRDPLFAGVAEWILPVVGHAYAGDASRGLLPNLVAFGGLAAGLAVCGLVDNECFEEGWTGNVLGLGLLTLVAGRAWAVVSAVNTARDTNALFRERLGLEKAGLDLSVTRTGRIATGIVVRF